MKEIIHEVPPGKKKNRDFDSPWKEALMVFFSDFMELCFPAIAKEIDWSREISFLDKEFQAMIKDAAAHTEDDKKFKELAELRNQADGMIHSSEKSLKDLEAEMSDEEKKSIESAIQALKDVVKSNDKDDIQAKLTALTELSGKMAERVYAKKAADGQQAESGAPEDTAAKPEDGVVDAEFEEVKGDDK